MARGEHFNHKNKNHPGEFPNNSVTAKHSKDAIGDEELIEPRKHLKIELRKKSSVQTLAAGFLIKQNRKAEAP